MFTRTLAVQTAKWVLRIAVSVDCALMLSQRHGSRCWIRIVSKNPDSQPWHRAGRQRVAISHCRAGEAGRNLGDAEKQAPAGARLCVETGMVLDQARLERQSRYTVDTWRQQLPACRAAACAVRPPGRAMVQCMPCMTHPPQRPRPQAAGGWNFDPGFVLMALSGSKRGAASAARFSCAEVSTN